MALDCFILRHFIRLNTNGDLELRAQKMLLLLFSQSIKVFRRRTRVFQGNATATTLSPRRPRAGMAVMCLASSSHLWHECDDRAERIELIRVKVHVRTMPVEQLAIARQLAAERPQLADVPALRLHVHS